jgi:hypothetical protein
LNECQVGRVGPIMNKIAAIALAFGASIYVSPVAQADDIQFTTLPQPVQTTVIRQTHIANPTYVTRVIRDENGVYAVTVRGETGDQVVYVNNEGAIVRAPTTTTTTTTTVRQPTTSVQTTQPGEGTVVTYDQVQQNLPRYQLLKKEGKKEVYYDRQTGEKVKVEREDH